LDTHCDALIEQIQAAMAATSDNKERVRGATHAYFDFVSHESEAFRLVFESDLRNDPAVRERVDRVEQASVDAITQTIMADTGVDKARAEILAAGLTGISQVAARYWLTGGREIAQEEAEALIAALSWRGIASFPLSDHPSDE
jgi:AcrR family transcriptional regulator